MYIHNWKFLDGPFLYFYILIYTTTIKCTLYGTFYEQYTAEKLLEYHENCQNS